MTTPNLTAPRTSATAGAGIFDSGANLIGDIGAIRAAQGEDVARLGVEIGVDVVALAFDVVKFVFNPFGSLISAGLGWVVEHFEPTRTLLTWVAGDPDQAQLVAQNTHALAETFTEVDARFDAGRSVIDPWQGLAAESCKPAMKFHHLELRALAATTETIGYIVHGCAAAVSVVRSLVRDLITTLVGDAIAAGLTALALAPITGGTSIVGFLGWLGVRMATVLGAAFAKIAKAMGLMSRSAARMTSLSKTGQVRPGSAGAAGTTRPPTPVRTTTAPLTTTASTTTASTVAPVTVRPVTRTPSLTSVTTPVAKPPPTPPKPYSGPWLKYHEHVLKTRAPNSWALLKRGEERIKTNALLAKHYPWLRKTADLDSSKEWIGWVGKAVTKGVVELSDIKWSAERGRQAQRDNPRHP
ncbi:hypothetical protein [Actinokineospora sp. NBRC 105648]|uniref:hypothetical protein n=1 Tax=Actinokineospora sp. NBRC 105648 TaxID=3032206 RepID=UPI0024A2D7C3|nr:hypothetical protein [Actinokineospora sp. NBRC 105648]GLZ38692.1 hypothetical protein Acsp05_23160 [Actinokineospora sp. NBRC 105648]